MDGFEQEETERPEGRRRKAFDGEGRGNLVVEWFP